jgi:hypothetical protein
LFGGETSKKKDIRKFADLYGLPVEMYIVLYSILATRGKEIPSKTMLFSRE